MQTAPTTYVNWQIDNGNILHKNYYGSETSWQYNEAEALEDFADMAQDKDVQIQYASLTDQYAVLVQGSNGMNNYRHQADVLSMYQMLRLNGFDDDHIILIIDGDLADNPNNNEPGIIRNSLTGNDLLGGTDAKENEKWREWIGNPQATGLYNPEYPSAIPDYDTDTLTARDIALILTGKRSSHLPTVLPQDQGNNVLLYWSGHGRNVNHGGTDELVWRETQAGNGMTATLLRETMEQMRYRKVFTIVEPCYSEGVILPLHGLTGVLAMSGASGDEQSWAENWNHGLGRYGTWMYDRFTKNVVDFLMEKPTAPFRDFYLYCMQNTIGSHVKLVNADFFGNLYTQNPEEAQLNEYFKFDASKVEVVEESTFNILDEMQKRIANHSGANSDEEVAMLEYYQAKYDSMKAFFDHTADSILAVDPGNSLDALTGQILEMGRKVLHYRDIGADGFRCTFPA